MRATISTDSKKNMCDSCHSDFATCKPDMVKFGDGIGNDNVVACSQYIVVPGYYEPRHIELAPELGIFKRTDDYNVKG